RGRNVSLGAVGSGTELIARRVLAAAGVSASEMKNAALGIDGSVEALRSGGIDAFFWSGGLPTPGVSELAGKLDIRLVELGSVVDGVRQVHGGAYRHGVVPEGMYGLEADIATMAVPNYLVVHADVSDELAYDVTRLLFEHRSKIAAEVPAAALLDRPRAIFTEPVELHEGALAYYRDTKL